MSGTCTCVPCTSPANGAVGFPHCAACCGGSGIEEYAHDCAELEHRELAELQHGPLALTPVDTERAG